MQCIVWDIFQTPVYCCRLIHIHVLFKYVQSYCGIFRILCNSFIFIALPYSESWHIWNLRYIQNFVKAYSGIFRTLCNAFILRTLPYLELCHIQDISVLSNPGIFRTLFIQAYQAYSIMIVIITLTFYFHFNLTYFSTKFKKTCFLTAVTWISIFN